MKQSDIGAQTCPQVRPCRFGVRIAFAMLAAGTAAAAWAGAQQYEPLAASVQAALHGAVSDRAAPEPRFPSEHEKIAWLTDMSARLARRMPDVQQRTEFLKTVYYEAQRAGLEPQLVLGLIQVESAFRKYAVSPAGARGYMQVMPFWTGLIGTPDTNLFHLRTNLRYGCTILRHYLDIERGDLFRALGRYNGSLGRPEYPNLVRDAWQRQWAGGERVAER
ncbi:MAG: lytic transglycosylase domain-containing protein [Rhodocyclaceae bacterium]|nr:lytic transglycosylase domain-containing protein [Rhodocyclaceae bacterium]